MFKKKKEKQTPAYWLGYVQALTTLKKSVQHAKEAAGVSELKAIHWEGAVCIALALAQEKLEKVVQDG